MSTLEALGDVVGQAEAVEGRGRHHDGVVVGRLGQAGLHVPAEARRSGGRDGAAELDLPAQRAGGHLRPLGQVGQRRADQRVARVAALGHRGDDETRAPRPTAGPWPLCTARSARPSRTAACTSLANTPLPPSSQIGTSSRRSPWVSTTTSSTVTSGSTACSSAATCSACQRASGLPRVAARSTRRSPAGRRACVGRAPAGHGATSTSSEGEQLAQRGDEAVAPGEPAASLRATDGSWSSLPMMPRVRASTASTLGGVEAAEASRGSGRARPGAPASARSRRATIIGATSRAEVAPR